MVLCRVLDKPGQPTEEDPDHRTEDDACKVRRLIYAIRVGGFVEKNAGYNLPWVSRRRGEKRETCTWCIPKNSALARMMPVYHGSSVKVMNMR